MKKVSANVFFTVLWRGVCQVVGWFFGLFGYKRDGKFAKCVWGLFAASAAVIVTLAAVVLVWSVGEHVYERRFKEEHCYDETCLHAEYVGPNVYYHDRGDGKGYIFNSLTREKTIKDVKWIAKPKGRDSLVCFNNGKRGYFNMNTGRVVVEPKYEHAWVFSEGLASVVENGYIKFIDATGKVVIDKQMAYRPYRDGYVFENGYCVLRTDDEKLCGLMDKTGRMVLPMEYNAISLVDEYGFWMLEKGKEMAVLDKDLKTILPLMECSLYIDEGSIDATMPDHTIRKYDLQGTLINDFYITGLRMLEYEKDELLYRSRTHDEDGDEYAVPFVDSYHPKAVARLRAYVAGAGFEGLMTADGHVVMMPQFKDIEAIGPDLYLCTSTNYDKVIINGKGEIVK